MTEPITPPPLATGGMSRSGTTTIVKINQPQVEGMDKKILCKAMCDCDKTPNIGIDGRKLKQNCVAAKMKTYSELMEAMPGYQHSEYKQEINYNMTTNPPTPIMDSTISTLAHKYLKGYIKKYMPGFVKGTGQIRRPDIVIVKDASKPPTQDNIKQIVEMKFPPDSLKPEQRADYETIAGDRNKLVKLEPSDCDCDAPEPKGTMIPVESLQTAGKVAQILMMLFGPKGGRGMGPAGNGRPVPAY
jgi:hypothetical protein